VVAVTTRVEPIDKDLDVIFAEDLSPAARSATLASVARAALADGDQQNYSVLGRTVPHKTFVDGSEGSSEDQVKPDGVIAYEFEVIGDLFVWVAAELKKHAPVLTGRFRDSLTLFADGVETKVGDDIPPASEYVFLSDLPYARKIEAGESKQAPAGVFEAVATLAQQRFGNMAKIRFGFRTPINSHLATGKVGNRSDNRTPAIIITLRS
jgi:hypothetical protein